MTKGKSQPDAGLYEVLVACAYKSRGWKTVTFLTYQKSLLIQTQQGLHNSSQQEARISKNLPAS